MNNKNNNNSTQSTKNANSQEKNSKSVVETKRPPRKSRKRKHLEIEYEKNNQTWTDPPPPPPRWKEVYERIQQMRSMRQAPVDTLGCEALSEKDTLPPPASRFHSLVSLLLSAQTRDKITAKAITNLKKLCGRDDFTPQDILQHTFEVCS
jgi:endonuclease-3